MVNAIDCENKILVLKSTQSLIIDSIVGSEHILVASGSLVVSNEVTLYAIGYN